MPKVDLTHYTGREQAYVKHCLLEEYLPEWAWKVGSQWDTIVYIDGFAGPWDVRSAELSDSSFGIAVDSLRSVAKGLSERGKRVGVKCVLVEQDERAFAKLSDFAAKASTAGFDVHALSGEFHSQLPSISRIAGAASNPFKFVFLDPKGWSLRMEQILPLIKGRSCEVVVNIMTRHIIRFFDQPDRFKSIVDFLGCEDAFTRLRDLPPAARPDGLVREYCKSLHILAGYRFVSSCAIFTPNRNEIKYFLVYGTNHFRGIEVFKAAESAAAKLQDVIRRSAAQEKAGGQQDMFEAFFGETAPESDFGFTQWKKYSAKAQSKVIRRLLDSNGEVSFSQIFCDSMAFPLVSPADMHGWLDEWKELGWIDYRFEGDRRKKLSIDKADAILILLRAELDLKLSDCMDGQ